MRITAPRAALGCSLIAGLLAVQTVGAQNNDPWHDRYGRDGRYDAYSRLARVEAGTYISVRTREAIETNRRDNRIFPAVVERDVWDEYGRLARPAIPSGAPADLLVRSAPDGDLILDLNSIVVDGRRYEVASSADRIDSNQRRDSGNGHAAEYIGGGAVLGTIIGAIAGGGKGAAIGAGAGAGAGLAGTLLTRGHDVRVPAGSVITFRLERDLMLGRAPNRTHERRE
jgi:hypothetical protein